MSDKPIQTLYQNLRTTYGHQQWWPADTPFEIAVGAILTQNTNWSNVEKALQNLKQAGCLSLEGTLALPTETLSALIRPAGYHNLKTKRLLNLCHYLHSIGGLDALDRLPLQKARSALLEVNGIGPETADDILLYALNKPSFVIDTYTRRLLQRYGLIEGAENYTELQQQFEQALPPDVDLFKEYHALIVQHAKIACRKKPICEKCRIRGGCKQQFPQSIVQKLCAEGLSEE